MNTVTLPDGRELVEFDMRNFLEGGILREASFVNAVEAVDWSQYSGKDVLVRACGAGPLPVWSYMLITAKLASFAASIYYGDVRNPVHVFSKGYE